jgi:hypothetical protein
MSHGTMGVGVGVSGCFWDYQITRRVLVLLCIATEAIFLVWLNRFYYLFPLFLEKRLLSKAK